MTGNTASSPQAAAPQVGNIAQSLAQAQQLVDLHFPGWWPRVFGGLAAIAALRLDTLGHCPTLIFAGPSSAGKSTLMDMLSGLNKAIVDNILRVDSITAASFVSQNANKTAKELDEQDLLPKLKDKVMLTRDLGTAFRGNPEQQKNLFAVLLNILDGKGYATAAGTHGLRDFSGEYIFTWLAVCLPLAPATWDAQKDLGSRFLYYDLKGPEQQTDEEIVRLRQGVNFGDKVKECRKAIDAVLAHIFYYRNAQGVIGLARGTTTWGGDPMEVQIWTVRLARLLSRSRTIVKDLADEDPMDDDPNRNISHLEALTRGAAILQGRDSVEMADLALATHVVFSSSRFGKLLRVVAEHPEGASVAHVMKALRCSDQTARNRMDTLVKRTFDLVEMVDAPSTQSHGRGRPTERVLVPTASWEWMRELKGLGWL